MRWSLAPFSAISFLAVAATGWAQSLQPQSAQHATSGAGTLIDAGVLCVSAPAESRRLHDQPIQIETATGDTFAVVSGKLLPLEMVYPGNRNYVLTKGWFASSNLTFLGRGYTKIGDPAPEQIRSMHPVGTSGDFWLFYKNGEDPENDLYVITAPGCEFQHYRSTAPPVRGARTSQSLPPRHRLVRFATDRGATEDPRPGRHFGTVQGTVRQGTAALAVPPLHEVGKLEAPWLFRPQDTLRHLVLLKLDPESPPNARRALLFIHGYDNSFEDAARRAGQLADDLAFEGDVYLFSWSSQGRVGPISYMTDETTVQRARTDFQVVLESLIREYGPGNISVIVHSLGNRGFAQAVRDIQPTYPGRIFDQVVLASPDQDVLVFRRDDAAPIVAAANHVTVYTSPADLALAASSFGHGGKRAGDDPIELADIPGLEVVDTSPEAHFFGIGHSDFADRPAVLGDLFLLLRGRTPEQRHLTEISTANGIFWQVP